MQANFGPAAAWGLGGVRGPLGAAGLARRPVCREVRGRAGEGSWPWWSGIQDCPVVVPGWVPSISPELAFLPCVEGLLAEREGDASLCTMIPAAGSRQQAAAWQGAKWSFPVFKARSHLPCASGPRRGGRVNTEPDSEEVGGHKLCISLRFLGMLMPQPRLHFLLL